MPSLHESVPGHHLQIALQQELTGLPRFRTVVSADAFTEGWGLYSERLGLEAGFYTDPYSNFGRIVNWMIDKSLRHEITTEIDRYISWPGQALAYKTGELKIRELRKRAEDALGTKFDRRAFHDAVLRNGAIPLDMLDEEVNAYIAAAR